MAYYSLFCVCMLRTTPSFIWLVLGPNTYFRPQHQLIASHLAGLSPGAIFSACGVARATGTSRHAMFLLWQLCQDGYIDAVPGTDRLYRRVRIPTETYERLRPILRLPSVAPRPVDVTKKLRRKRVSGKALRRPSTPTDGITSGASTLPRRKRRRKRHSEPFRSPEHHD